MTDASRPPHPVARDDDAANRASRIAPAAGLDAARDSSSPRHFFDADGTLYFAVDDGVHGFELWESERRRRRHGGNRRIFTPQSIFGIDRVWGGLRSLTSKRHAPRRVARRCDWALGPGRFR